ncbi:MAG: hypothetical protein CMP36_03000 [Rickettsiales bacterium]|nr:hypothetical protein [Rickettsiales bacterium]OUV79418.1 MAG: hypothetical protein CBC91_03690 [Rickettsiales bacterium TMED131]|tara:strand:- start:136 stop:429 length:294 start_codon:yes stop_codon:yes gene_type:complete
MLNKNYKVFFTISFSYEIEKKKIITKSFKSDIDINNLKIGSSIDDSNVHKKWKEYALSIPLNNLNPPVKFIDEKVKEKVLKTHRIVNLENLTEVHKK